MGRWSHLDTDEERLPEGMTRVGYDGDTQVYTYQDSDGSYWEGAPGVKYGRLYRVKQTAPVLPSAWVTGDITGHEPAPYPLPDYDFSSDDNRPAHTSFSQIFGEDDDAASSSSDGSHTVTDEKRQAPRSNRLPSFPDRAVIHPSLKRKPVSKLPTNTNTNADADADNMSIASTLVDRSSSIRSIATTSTVTSDVQTPPTRRHYQNGSVSGVSSLSGSGSGSGGSVGLRRSGTLSRLAQFLSTSRSGIARRATVNGEAGMTSHHRGSVAGRRQGPAGENGQWPASPGSGSSAGAGTGGGPRGARARKRATTFDDILGPGQ
jgi:hypothetical protein